MTGSVLPPFAAEGRRQEILDAALESFVAKGVAATSISDIRRRSGASVGSIYHHFAGKDAIAGVLYVEGLAEYQDGFLSVLAQADDTRAAVESAVRRHLRWLHAHPGLARFLLLARDASVIVATQAPVREQNQRFLAAFAEWVRPRVEARELRDLPPELISALWLGPSQEFARGWLSQLPERETSIARTQMSTAQAALPPAAWRALSGP
jgi:AcrR family transcriptional regulator